MKKIIQKSVILLGVLLISKSAFAAFPYDLSDVVFIEAPYVKEWPVGAGLDLSFGGGNIYMPYGGAGSWPSVRPSSLGGAAVNANAWGIVKVGGIWHAGTWEYFRPGQTTKKQKAFGGCCHFRPPINNFNLVNGENYAIFISGVVRDTSGGINIQQRTNYSLFKWGTGVIYVEGSGGAPGGGVVPAPAIDILLDEDVVLPPMAE